MDQSVGARDELHESEASQDLIVCLDSASPEKSCFVVDYIWSFLFCLPLRFCVSELPPEELLCFVFCRFPVHR